MIRKERDQYKAMVENMDHGSPAKSIKVKSPEKREEEV